MRARRKAAERPAGRQPSHVRVLDASGRPLDVRPDQAADLLRAGLAFEVAPERYTERPGSAADMAAGNTVIRSFEPAVYRLRPGRLAALRRWLARLDPPEAPAPVRGLLGPRPTPRPLRRPGEGLGPPPAPKVKPAPVIVDDPFPDPPVDRAAIERAAELLRARGWTVTPPRI